MVLCVEPAGQANVPGGGVPDRVRLSSGQLFNEDILVTLLNSGGEGGGAAGPNGARASKHAASLVAATASTKVLSLPAASLAKLLVRS
jgi:hypothetical protein